MAKRTMDAVTDRMLAEIQAKAGAIQAEFEFRKDVPLQVRAGQSRMIRTIMSMPVPEMVRQLR